VLLIYISTDYVFAGRPGEAPYKTTDPPDPPNLYGRTKYEGEQAVLAATTAQDGSGGTPSAVVLRVPLLYGHCEPDEKTKSAVHPLLDALRQAQKLESGAPKIKVDSYGLRFPTCTEDVGRVTADVATLYLDNASKDGGAKLPSILHFSAEQRFTKWDMVRVFADEILGMPLGNLEPHDPTKDEAEAGATQRPYDSHLDTSVLKDIGVDYSAQDFVAWW
jgi:S-adenosylmethionine synthetase